MHRNNVVQMFYAMLLVLFIDGLLLTNSYTFTPYTGHLHRSHLRRTGQHLPLRSFVDDDDLFRSLFTDEPFDSKQEAAAADVQGNDIIHEIQWRSMKVKLEEDFQRRFKQSLQSKPRKLPYTDARLWIQANLGPDTKEEFMDMVANGNLKTPYIPKQPDVYYGEEGTWVSWDHFLHGIFEVKGTRKRDDDSLETE